MRELTSAEIEDFDFSGRIPELNVTSQNMNQAVVAKTKQPNFSRKTRPFVSQKPRSRFGMTRTA